ncbi:VPS4-associated protein 1 [Scheffersomyces coipomensis]|uniref:VPS4-associated protein 1 n=1 Tax=Scheffersomyces coipomensis TaxID=1788519 RepID=UPI00315D3773
MSSNQPPFPNIYHVKQVASTDSKSCSICYKLTSTVLLNDTKIDFLYICPGHLKDSNFSDHLEDPDYDSLTKDKSDKTKKVEELTVQAEAIKPYLINQLISDYLPKKKKEGDDGDKSKDGASDDKYKTLQNQIKELNKELVTLNEKINEFKFKRYKLNNEIYKLRILNYNKALYNKIRHKKIQSDPSFFPTVPNNKIE